jgi:ectoine hydroxylase-related dioxygenase (phytanoyl-CoA dioxygenase family)
MATLTTLPATANTTEILSVVEQDGAVILKDLISPALVDQMLSETLPYIEATRNGENELNRLQTTRSGAQVARSPACREIVINPSVTQAATAFLTPYFSRIQLHVAQIIRIRPGETKQYIHRDRWAWGTNLKGVEPLMNTLWAITDFTADNGATQVVPGSESWPDDRVADTNEIARAVMTKGSVLLYTGTVFHGAGNNASADGRIALNIDYALGWLRQEENQYLSCPPEVAKTLSPELQDLLGYTLGGYALGYYTPPLPAAGEGPDCVGPEYAVGREVEGDGIGNDELLADIMAQTNNAGFSA